MLYCFTHLLMKWVFIFSVDFDKINLDNDKNGDNDDPDTIINFSFV